MTGIRLQLALAKAGIASRRHAEQLIASGRVQVNGQVVTTLGSRVDPVCDRITVDGKPIEREASAYILLYKPAGYVTTAADPAGRPTVFSLLLPPPTARLFAVGRLDYNTAGALLLTNDGELAHALMHPSRGVEKVYHAKLDGLLSAEQIARLRVGVLLPPPRPLSPADRPPRDQRPQAAYQPERSAPAKVMVSGTTARHTWLEITLHEGKNRQIHRMAEAIGSSLRKLIRVRYASLTLDDLAVGEHRALNPREVAHLRRLVGLRPLLTSVPQKSEAPTRHPRRGTRPPGSADAAPRRGGPPRRAAPRQHAAGQRPPRAAARPRQRPAGVPPSGPPQR